MKIDVPSIPPEGQSFEFDQDTAWFSKLLAHEFKDIYVSGKPARGELSLYKTNENVSCNGDVDVVLNPQCSRCAAGYSTELEIPIVRHLVPQFSLGAREPGKDEEGIELSEEDLDFGSYQNEEIDLGQIVTEEIRLALPIRFLCKESCEGLCPKCGANLNEGLCTCPRVKEGSPFAVLKDLKIKS